ncbi:MAG: S41 family peptidase, partial [Bacteroidales bacterium]|nr:S41 family peptidase [Bacteroidales bacterium]
MKKHNIGYVLVPLFLCLGIIGGIFIGKYSSQQELSPEEIKFRSVLGLIRDQYVDEIDIDSLLDKSIPDLLASLDPHSAYIPAEDLTITNDDLEGSFGGIGVSFQILNDTVNVIEVIAGGPAEKVGLLPGDKILEANGKKLSGANVSTEDVFKILRGAEGTVVKTVVKRRTSRKPLTYEIVRGEIPSNSVDAKYLISGDIGYIKVSKFARTTYPEFFTALTELKNQGAKKYIVDLRGNSGGFMDQAIYMVNEFLPEGRKIVYTKGRSVDNETMAISDGTGQFQNVPLTVITNEFSASASEIFAGAIQDNDRGLVIGRRSFGKGLVQNQISLPDSSAVRLTVARYYTPSGRSIQKEYKRGKDGKYEMDILDRYSHGEFYTSDSIKLDKSKKFRTFNGRTVYGGGGIMPDIFVPEDTTGYTSYYLEATNRGLINEFAQQMADSYRSMMRGQKTMEQLERVLPRDNTLLQAFVGYAANHGLPARWYYINQSRSLLLNQIKAVIARDLIGYQGMIRILNTSDKTVLKAIEKLQRGESPVN